MSSNIAINRICVHCGNDFIARTTVTKYCSHKCNNRALKAKIKAEKVQKSNAETKHIKTKDIEDVKSKMFLTVANTAELLGCSKRTVYRLIHKGTINAVNLSERMIRIKRSELDKLMETPKSFDTSEYLMFSYNHEDVYSLSEIIAKYGVSSSALYQMLLNFEVPKTKKGKEVFVPKYLIDNIFN